MTLSSFFLNKFRILLMSGIIVFFYFLSCSVYSLKRETERRKKEDYKTKVTIKQHEEYIENIIILILC